MLFSKVISLPKSILKKDTEVSCTRLFVHIVPAVAEPKYIPWPAYDSVHISWK